ncbi:AAA family ATPase [Vampirovibrio chlorellavorus]|uniref:AAA family ATPase n=1 Tax=Vampirovibrio chlorellavorus TaxID=758823 RepID=UPI0026ED80EC|nr:AAA family ATPase [Vampirovibrio chlorellavorus]
MSTENPTIQESFTLEQLLAKEFPEPRWVVDTLLTEGLTILSGGPKMGKSWMALTIGIAIALDTKVFDKLSTQTGSVLYLALEDNFRRLQVRCKKLLSQEQIPNDKLIFRDTFKKMDAQGIQDLQELLEKNPSIHLVIIDTWGRAKPSTNGKAANYETETLYLGALQRLAVDKGISILVFHHTRKGTGNSEDAFDDVLGSTAITGVADTNLILIKDRMTGTATLRMTGRDIQDNELYLQFDAETVRWKIVEKPQVQPGETESKILAAFEEEEIFGPKEAAEKTEMSEDRVKKALGRMVEKGFLLKENRGKYQKPFTVSLPTQKAHPETTSTETEGLSPNVTSEEDNINPPSGSDNGDSVGQVVVTSQSNAIPVS